ncbi:hypothetical protein HUJ05_010191 [Dendroctonus ponderosae]|nr:hypothetical protein HUJ05_010191 [Dendroctonus ponderosae]
MDFARQQLEKYGWNEGKGLGRAENGISQAIKPKLKFDNAGIGHDAAEQFTHCWWERAYNSANNNIEVSLYFMKFMQAPPARDPKHTFIKKECMERKVLDIPYFALFMKSLFVLTGNEMRKKSKDKDFEISTKTYSVQNLKNKTSLLYGSFIKTERLTENGTEHYNVPILETEPLKSYQGMTDEELFASCEGRTVHKGARHGLNLTGKLLRIEKQEKMLLKKMKKISLSEDSCSKADRKLKKLEKHKQCEGKITSLAGKDDTPSTSQISTSKKSKKRKSVTFYETVTKIYTEPDSKVVPVRDDNSGSDEGIEKDLLNNNNEVNVDHDRAFEETSRMDMSTQKRKFFEKRRMEAKLCSTASKFLESVSTKTEDHAMQVEKHCTSKKRKRLEEKVDLSNKRKSIETPELSKKKKNKKKKHKISPEEAKKSYFLYGKVEVRLKVSPSAKAKVPFKNKDFSTLLIRIDMGNVGEKVQAAEVVSSAATVNPSEPPKKLKPCCACPETKKVRDQCIIENGEENCKDLIEAHKKCMRDLGFNI